MPLPYRVSKAVFSFVPAVPCYPPFQAISIRFGKQVDVIAGLILEIIQDSLRISPTFEEFTRFRDDRERVVVIEEQIQIFSTRHT